MRAIDAATALAGTPTRVLMENAGAAVADTIAARMTPRPTAVLCGPGNNGGDGWVAARRLMQLGWPVWVQTLVPQGQLWGDAFDAATAFSGDVHLSSELCPAADYFIDAMFGAGLTRPLDGEAGRLARMLAARPQDVCAVDVPSGLDGDSAKSLGEACVRAALTVTFERKKLAHVLLPGRGLCGEIVVAPIGATVEAAEDSDLFENDPSLWAFPWPDATAHKHARGHAMIASGGVGRSGAARLAARAALRVGAGLVTVLSPPDAVAENAAQLTAIMLRGCVGDELAGATESAQSLVIGPAFGTESAQRAALGAVLSRRARPPAVLDADALTLLAPLRKSPLGAGDVLTPHVGEFRRLFPDLIEASANRVEAARAAAQRAGAVTLLKGPDTVIAAPGGRAIVNTTGTPFLATAGAGDVLAGLIGGLMAQGMESFAAAGAGAWLHGAAAERLGPGLIAEDVCEILPEILNDLAPTALKRRTS